MVSFMFQNIDVFICSYIHTYIETNKYNRRTCFDIIIYLMYFNSLSTNAFIFAQLDFYFCVQRAIWRADFEVIYLFLTRQRMSSCSTISAARTDLKEY